MDFDITVVPKGSNGTVRLSVDYDGAAPPTDLFADLTMIGWNVPALAPPPREAIDWSTPNPETGQRFSVSSWQVEGFVIEPPVGSGSRGTWSADESRPFLTSLNGVLKRHGFDLLGRAGETPAPVAEAPAPPPSVRPGLPTLRSLLADQPTPVASDTPAVAVEAIGVPADLDPVRLVADFTDHVVQERAELSLSTIGVTTRMVTVERVTHENYRASTYDRTHQVAVIDMTLPRSSMTAVIAVLHEFGATPLYDIERFIEVDKSLGAVAAATPILAAVQGEEDAGATLATIRLLIDPPYRILLVDELDDLPVVDVTWTKTERTTTEKFRGSDYERTVPALQLDVTVAPDMVVAVGSLLAETGGFTMDDAERFQVRMPAGGAPAAPAGETSPVTGKLRTA